MARNYAALPHEYLEELDALNDSEFGRLARALLVYSMTGEPIALCGNERFYAKRVMAQEDRFQASYEEQFQKLSERGKAGANARWENAKASISNAKDAKACLSITSNAYDGNTETKTDTNTETNTLPSNDGRSNKAHTRFVPPTLDEVAAYCLERKNKVDPQRFADYYTANGWRVGKNPMKDWKAAVRSWENNGHSSQKSAKSMVGVDFNPKPDAIKRSQDKLDKLLAGMEGNNG